MASKMVEFRWRWFIGCPSPNALVNVVGTILGIWTSCPRVITCGLALKGEVTSLLQSIDAVRVVAKTASFSWCIHARLIMLSSRLPRLGGSTITFLLIVVDPNAVFLLVDIELKEWKGNLSLEEIYQFKKEWTLVIKAIVAAFLALHNDKGLWREP
jgi:hypothetical protein